MELIGLLLVFSFLSMVIGTVAKGVVRLVGFGVLAALLIMAVGSLDSDVLPNMLNSARNFVARVQQQIAGGGGGGQQDFNATQTDPYNFENAPAGQSPTIPNSQFSNPQFPNQQFPNQQFPNQQFPNQPFNDPNAPLNRSTETNRRPVTALW
jgi:hypothetical protein